MQDEEQVTVLLKRWGSGDAQAFEVLWPMVHGELRSIAQRYLRRERGDHTLQATALVNEAFLKLVGQESADWQNRQHFVAIAAQAMRRILVDHARRLQADKRPQAADRVTLEGLEAGTQGDTDLVALDEALERLAVLDPRQAQVVELKFFGGLNLDEIGAVLGIGSATVSREWRMARAWLKTEIERS